MRTVLVVDDHPSFRASARAVLESAGFAVVGEASTGTEALAEIDRLGPDLVLLDVQLPDMTGFDVCRALVGVAGGPTVILVSSRDESDYGSDVADSGAAGFIAKAELAPETVEALLT
ncbi:MAG: response regulator transcription factor [Gaiellales bacterium]